MENLRQLFAEGMPDILVQLSIGDSNLHINRTPPGRSQSEVLGRRREPVDLNSVVQHTVAVLSRLVGADVAVVGQLDPSAVTILGDRGEVEQILVNLLLNACEAVGTAGTVTVSTQRLLDESIAMVVSDDGIGITEDVQAKIFQAFFITKPSEKGTGLGLASVSALVGSQGGTIGVTSRVGEGTTFEIVFPPAAMAEPLEML